MKDASTKILDANEATAHVAYRTHEVIAIYPITPASPMGEHADAWAAAERPNIWGGIPRVVEMQAEGGAAGAVHGALQGGALTTTFTASQGLLLMLPNLYKIAGELTPMVLHVAARSIATHALSIFGDHSDVYACRQSGFAMLASNSPQEAHDLACIAQAATLKSRIPFLHFFDGFRTSHELTRVKLLSDDVLREMLDMDAILAFGDRALNPDKPVVRGTAQNPDVFFQAREAVNPYYDATPGLVAEAMELFAKLTGREYKLFEYEGHPEAERVIVMMGSGCETGHETIDYLSARGEKVGLLKVRLYRPFSPAHLLAAMPKTTRSIAVLDRTKEPGALGEPLYQEVITALFEANSLGLMPFDSMPTVVGGRYGLSSKEFTPARVKAVLDNMSADAPKNHFTVGINDDVTHSSLPEDVSFDVEPEGVVEAVFYGLGSDGTVGANKNSLKIIGDETDLHTRGYFVYDSKKSGAVTVSHLRFGPEPIRSTHLITSANFVACHQWVFVDKLDVLSLAADGATFLLNSPYATEDTWAELPREVQEGIREKKLKVYVINASAVARDVGMGRRINTIMQTCFFALSGVLPRDEAIAKIKEKVQTTYGSKGEELVRMNLDAIDATLSHLHEMEVPVEGTSERVRPPVVRAEAPQFIHDVTAKMLAGKGDYLPVSAFLPDGTWPTATSQWGKTNIALEIPIWEPDLCIQCNKCAVICPHSAIRVKVFDNGIKGGAPDTFQTMAYKGREFKGDAYNVQVAPEDCTGCNLCVQVCPGVDKANPEHKAINMQPKLDHFEVEQANFDFFLSIPDTPRTDVPTNLKGSQFLRPLFEYSGACAGCGETPYIKLMTQLFGDRTLIANATGCSSIYGGNLPTTPYCVNDDGRGPAWSNSLFEDNAEFGLGMRLAVDSRATLARELLVKLGSSVGDELVTALLGGVNLGDEAGIKEQRERVAKLGAILETLDSAEASHLKSIADYLVRKNVWIVGGDGWAYDIGYGGLDHVLASGEDVNILVLDTQVYSNTGGQSSKATPRGAIAKFAANGKGLAKKNLGMLAMMHDGVYVASVALGAKDAQTYKAFVEAESWHGPSIIIAFSPCIAHGYDLGDGAKQQKLAVDTGFWPLFRYDPRRADNGKNPLQLDSKAPKVDLEEYAYNERRFRMLKASDPGRASALMEAAQEDTQRTFEMLERLAKG